MTKLFRRLFIKDFNNVSNPQVRKKHGYLASTVGIITNLILFIIKIIIGLLIFSMSIISDAINNLTDMASCFANLLGFKLAGKPADKDHPFGHERIEYITGLIISFVMIAIAVVAGYTSIMKLINKESTDYSNKTNLISTFVILGLAILLKVWQSCFYRGIAKAIDSISIKANAQDSLNDAISTTAVALSAIIEVILLKNNIVVNIDGWMGLAVSFFIIYSGIKLVIESSNPLIGITPDSKLIQTVVSDIKNKEGVLGIHDLMCHSYGPSKIFMTIHVEVDYNTPILESHDLMDQIEIMINEKYGILLTCHMDPIVTDDQETLELKDKVSAFLKNYDPSINFHDFRLVKGQTHTNVLFDVLLSFESKINEKELKDYIIKEIQNVNPFYKVIIKIDRNYVEKE